MGDKLHEVSIWRDFGALKGLAADTGSIIRAGLAKNNRVFTSPATIFNPYDSIVSSSVFLSLQRIYRRCNFRHPRWFRRKKTCEKSNKKHAFWLNEMYMSIFECNRYIEVQNPCLADFAQNRCASSLRHEESTDILAIV